MSNIAIFKLNQQPQYLTSVHTPDYSSDPDVLVNPDISAVINIPLKNWKRVGNSIVEMTLVEKQAIIDAELLARKAQADDFRIEGMDKSISFLQSGGVGRLPENLKHEVDGMRRDVSVISSRLDSLENVSHDFADNMIKMDSTIHKFESFEKASALGKELEAKVEEFRFIEGEIRRLSNRIESIYDSIDKRLDKVKNVEKKFPELF